MDKMDYEAQDLGLLVSFIASKLEFFNRNYLADIGAALTNSDSTLTCSNSARSWQEVGVVLRDGGSTSESDFQIIKERISCCFT